MDFYELNNCIEGLSVINPVVPKAKPSGTSVSTDRDGAPPPESMVHKGDPLIRELFQNGTDSVHDMHAMNTDAKIHAIKIP